MQVRQEDPHGGGRASAVGTPGMHHRKKVRCRNKVKRQRTWQELSGATGFRTRRNTNKSSRVVFSSLKILLGSIACRDVSLAKVGYRDRRRAGPRVLAQSAEWCLACPKRQGINGARNGRHRQTRRHCTTVTHASKCIVQKFLVIGCLGC